MSFLPTVPYADVAADVAALVGNSAPTTVAAEALRVKSYINMALRRAYAASPWWERYLIAAREVSLDNGVISRNGVGLPDSMVVAGAGPAADGIYVKNDEDAEGMPRWGFIESDAGITFQTSPHLGWYIIDTNGVAILFGGDVESPDLVQTWVNIAEAATLIVNGNPLVLTL